MIKFRLIYNVLISLIFYSCVSTEYKSDAKSDNLLEDSIKSCLVLDSYSIVVDSNFLSIAPKEPLRAYPKFKGSVVDVGQEGYPEVLSNLDYFIDEEVTLSPCVKLLIVYGKIPENYLGHEVSNFKSVFLLTIDDNGVQIDDFLLGKINESTDKRLQVTSTIQANRIIRTETDRWTSANGDYHVYEKIDTFFLNITGVIASNRAN